MQSCLLLPQNKAHMGIGFLEMGEVCPGKRDHSRGNATGLVFSSGSGYLGGGDLEMRLGANRTRALPSDEVSGLADFGML